MEKFDLEQVIKHYWHGANSERAELIKTFREAVTHGGPEFKLLLAEVAEEVYKNGLGPVQCLACAMMYGMAIGVLVERERRKIV